MKKKRHYDWLDASEQWRIGYAFKCLSFFPKWIFRYINDIGYNEDLEQVMKNAIFITKDLEINEASRIIQKEIRSFLKTLMLRKRGGQWKAVEFSRPDEELKGYVPAFNIELLDVQEPINVRKQIPRDADYNRKMQERYRNENREFRRAYQRALSRGININKKEWEKMTKEERKIYEGA